jgi:hypothetical protein
MPQSVTITSVTANTPVEIFYCDSTSGSCVYVSTVSVFPYTFDVPSPYDETNIVIKIEDVNGCVDGDIIYITPTPTSSNTPTATQTPTVTPTNTSTPTVTPTQTITPTTTITTTPTNTPTPSATPVASIHPIGQNAYVGSGDTCYDVITINNLYTYINQANLVPVIGVTVYQSLFNGTLFSPYNGQNKWILMGWGGFDYSVQIDSSGTILDYILCNNLVTPTPTLTPSPTFTPSPSRLTYVEFYFIYYGVICGEYVDWHTKTKEEVKCDFYEAFNPLVQVGGDANYYRSTDTFIVGTPIYYYNGTQYVVNTFLTGNYIYGPGTLSPNPSTDPLYVVGMNNGIVTEITNINDIATCGTYVC